MFMRTVALWGAIAGEPTGSVVSEAVDAPTDGGWSFSLRWHAPPGCPQGPEILDDVARLLGEPVSTGSAGDTRIAGEVRELSTGDWTMSLDIHSSDGKGQRVLTGASCRELAEAAVVVIAVTIAPASAFPVETAEPPPDPNPRAATRSTALVRTTRLPAPPTWRWSLWAAPILSSGPLPTVGYGFAAGGQWGRNAWRLEAAGGYLAPRIKTLADDDDRGAQFDLAWAGLRGCWRPTRNAIAFPSCLGAHAGRMYAAAFGFEDIRSQAKPWVAADASVGVSWSMHDHVGAFVRGSVAVPMVRPSFQHAVGEAEHPVHAPAPIALFAFAGVELGVL